MLAERSEVDTDRRVRSIGQILDRSIVLIVRAAVPLLVLGIALITVPYAVQSIATHVASPSKSGGKSAILFLTYFCDIIVRGAFVFALTDPRPSIATVRNVLPVLLRTAVRLVVLAFYTALIVLVSCVILAVPAIPFFGFGLNTQSEPQRAVSLLIYFGPSFCLLLLLLPSLLIAEVFATTAIVREDTKPRRALANALRLMFAKKQRLRSILVSCCAFAPTFAIAVLMAMLKRVTPSAYADVLFAVYGLVLVATSSFEMSVAVTYRRDLQIRVEGLDLQIEAMLLAQPDM